MKMRSKRIDEPELFLYYCQSEGARLKTYAEVAREFGITHKTVEVIGAKHNWVERRKKFSEERLLSLKKYRDEIIEQAEQRQYEIWMKALKTLEWELELIHKKQEHYEVAISVDPTGQLARKTGAFDQRQLMEALKTAVNGMRVSLGLPTEITKGELQTKNINVELTTEEVAAMDDDLRRLNENQNVIDPAAN